MDKAFTWTYFIVKESEDFELGVVTLISTIKGSIRIRVNPIMWTSNLLDDLFPWELTVNPKEFFFSLSLSLVYFSDIGLCCDQTN